MERTDLLRVLDGDVSHIEKVNINDSALYGVKIPVLPKNVEKMLQAYLSGNLAEKDLNNWANFLCLRSEYISAGYENEELADYYENMWYVIQRLSTPEIDGEINKEQVKLYLNEIRTYTNNKFK